ncbi:MAG: 3-isopropylmalate dehydratase small subunit [Anaerolineaceae bacterium]|nr:3-isopropylmalate dehydratase small subunit [Anaerolineaceae bacterium]
MEPINKISGKIAPLPMNDVDTDQIIPARFLKTTNKDGLGQQCFFDWRYTADGGLREDFILNQPEYQDASVLIAGNNFGCGSSREHAPWALQGMGWKAVVSTEFADIFRNNSLKNGLIPIIVDDETHRQLMSLAEEDPTTEVSINLEDQQLILPDGRKVEFPIDGFSKYCLLNGVDQLGYLMGLEDEIVEYEGSHDKRVVTTA